MQHKLTVEDHILTLLAKQVTKVPWPVGAAALVVCIMAWDRAPHWALISWVTLIWVVQLTRWQTLSKLPTSPSPIAHRLNMAVALSALNGVCHACSVAFFPYLTEGQRSVLSLVLAGISTGAVGTTSGHPRIFHAFALPTMFTLAVGWALTPLNNQSVWIGLAMGGFLLAYQAILSSLARGAYQSLEDSIAMQLQQQQLNEELRLALAHAEEANAAKTRFLASASHDLRQPLHTLTLFCAALMSHRLEPRTNSIVQNMDAALQMLRTQLTALLDISKLDAQIVPVTLTSVDIIGFARRIHQEFSPIALQKNLQLTLDVQDMHAGDVYILSDPLHLERIVRNLLDNAIKYCDAGTIWLRLTVARAHITVTIQDTGRGIPSQEISRIYEEFYQIDNPERDRTRGLGLGLAIVKRLTQLLNCPMTLTSELGIGTSVSLRFNKTERDNTQVTAEPPSTSGIPVCHLLILDDEEAILEAMRALLESHGCRVTTANSTDEAMQKAAKEPPDLVLADFRLRGQESGIKAIRKLRQQCPNLPAILISGDTAEERLREAQEAGLPLLHKPLAVQELLNAISNNL